MQADLTDGFFQLTIFKGTVGVKHSGDKLGKNALKLMSECFAPALNLIAFIVAIEDATIKAIKLPPMPSNLGHTFPKI